jgi:hypothetical protein
MSIGNPAAENPGIGKACIQTVTPPWIPRHILDMGSDYFLDYDPNRL